MQKQCVLITLLTSLVLASIGYAGNILLIRQGGSLDPNDLTIFPEGNTTRHGVFTAQEQIGYTNVDDTFVVALTNAGHRVTTFWINNANISDADLLSINTNDACLISYSCNSGPFNMGSAANINAPEGSTNAGRKWNTLVTAPIILIKGNLARPGANRLGWFTGYSSNDWITALPNTQPNPSDYDTANNLSTTASGKLTFVDQNNPLFAGITYTNNGSDRVMSNYFSVDIAENLSNPELVNYFIPGIPFPLNNRGNSLPIQKVVVDGLDQNYTNDLSPGGKVLATMEFNPRNPGIDINGPTDVYPNWIVTGVAIAEWPAGSRVWRNCGDGTEETDPFCDTLAGYRMFFSAGTRDPNGTVRADGYMAGGYNLTADGTKIFRRAVDRAILKGDNPALSAVPSGSSATISWNPAIKTWKLQSSSNLTTWTDVASGVVNNSYTVPAGGPGAQFFRLAVN